MMTIHVAFDACEKAMHDQQKRMDKATMWGVREVGRAVKAEARRHAPVYKGSRKISRKEFKSRLAARTKGQKGFVEGNQVVAGLLKNSIHSSKRLRKVEGGGYALKVAPRGVRVHLYSGKEEARDPYMAFGHRVAINRHAELMAKAWGRAMEHK